MSVRGWSQKEVLNPRGAWAADALVHKGTPSRAALAQNVRFFPGMAYSREGTSAAIAAPGIINGMFNWIAPASAILSSPADSFLAYMSGTSVARYRFSGGTTESMQAGAPASYAPAFADLGPRMYYSLYDVTGAGTQQARVADNRNPPAVDACFRGALTFTSFTATDAGAGGFCTQGTHKILAVFQSRNGYLGVPSPASLTPATVTLNTGNRGISVAITLDTPADAGPGSSIFLIMTRADNPSLYYFVPGLFAILPANVVGWVQGFSISVSDEDLAASGDIATNQFNLLTNPGNPSVVAAYGLRMCYLVANTWYISEINDPQRIAADLNAIQTLNQRRMSTGAPLGQEFVMYGDRWTGGVTDNGDEPVTWPTPRTISDSIGAPFPNCVCAKTAGSYHWVASEAGVYAFDGSYPNRPITYFSSDWGRINWAAAYAIQMCDDIVNLRLYVAAPLDGATAPTHLFTIDYTNGLTFDTCDISLDNFGFGGFQSICMVKEQASNRTALWIGPRSAGSILHLDPSTHSDAGPTAVHAVWESGYVRDASDPIQSSCVRVGAAHLWVRGSGSLLFNSFGLDRAIQIGPDIIPLLPSPGQELYSKIDLHPVENFTHRFEVNNPGDWFQVSGFRTYTKPSFYNR